MNLIFINLTPWVILALIALLFFGSVLRKLFSGAGKAVKKAVSKSEHGDAHSGGHASGHGHKFSFGSWFSKWVPITLAFMIMAWIFKFMFWHSDPAPKKDGTGNTGSTNTVPVGKVRTSYVATKDGTKVIVKTYESSTVMYGKVKVTTPDGETYHDAPGIKLNRHDPPGTYIFRSEEKSGFTEFEVWQ
ncbi:MAG: hypothetical protein V4439_00825 [Patescibacteria group bacterium]